MTGHELSGYHCCIAILIGKTKHITNLSQPRMLLWQTLWWGIVLLVNNLFLSAQAGYWLPTVRCVLADKPPPCCTLPSGLQFTGCNLVEKMWSLLVLGTDRLLFVHFCRAGRMLGAGKKQGTDDSMKTGERVFRCWKPECWL